MDNFNKYLSKNNISDASVDLLLTENLDYENFNNKYPNLIIMITTDDALKDIEELLNAMSGNNYMLFPNYTFQQCVDEILDISFNYSENFYIRLSKFKLHYGDMNTLDLWKKGKDYEKIYTLQDLDKIKCILKYGKYIPIPNYAPRKIIKESVDNDYLEIVVQVNNYEEYKILEKKLSDNDIYFNISVDLKKLDTIEHFYNSIETYPVYILFNFNNKDTSNIKSVIYITKKDKVRNKFKLDQYIYNDPQVYKPVFTIDNIRFIILILQSHKIIKEPSYKPRKIIKESNINELYKIKTKQEFEKEFGEEWRNRLKTTWCSPEMDFLFGYVLSNSEIVQLKTYLEVKFKDKFIDEYTKWLVTDDMIKQVVPNYAPRKIIKENNMLLEKSSLSALGIPNNVMQSIQSDFALSPDANWERIRLKRDCIEILTIGRRELLIQIATDGIKVFAVVDKEHFIDRYLPTEEGEWGENFKKTKREYISLNQISLEIEPRALIYHLIGDFSDKRKPQRNIIKKETEFTEFTEQFKKDFIYNFNSVLKRIVGSNYKDAKDEILVKAKQIEKENNMIITGLENPLEGGNGLTILDDFLMQFENAYSEFFGEHTDIYELSKIFTRDKIMLSFMLYIYTGKIITT
jgi:hypothetical protein